MSAPGEFKSSSFFEDNFDVPALEALRHSAARF